MSVVGEEDVLELGGGGRGGRWLREEEGRSASDRMRKGREEGGRTRQTSSSSSVFFCTFDEPAPGLAKNGGNSSLSQSPALITPGRILESEGSTAGSKRAGNDDEVEGSC